ncbi:MAG: hypothetical protein Q6366_003350 [Candidatus Freyarchaeota archaeon]
MIMEEIKIIPLQFGFEIFAFIPLIILIVWCVIAIALAVWVYKDAEERGMEGALWLIIVLLLGLIGLIIYLIVRE